MASVDFFSFSWSYPSKMPDTLAVQNVSQEEKITKYLLWVIFIEVAVEAFENGKVDIREVAWLQGQVDLLLHRGDSGVLRLAQLSQLG